MATKHLSHCSDVIADLKNMDDEEVSEGVVSQESLSLLDFRTVSRQHQSNDAPMP